MTSGGYFFGRGKISDRSSATISLQNRQNWAKFSEISCTVLDTGC